MSKKMSFLQEAKQILESVAGVPQKAEVRKKKAIELARYMLQEANRVQTRKDKAQQAQLARMMQDPQGKAFTTEMTDQGFRSQQTQRVANQMNHLLDNYGVPSYVSAWKKLELSAFRTLSPLLHKVLVPLATSALRKETAAVILPGEPAALSYHMHKRRRQGVRLNLNHLGEAILGEEEAARRLRVYLEDLTRDDIEYVSIKISTIYSQIHLLGWRKTLEVVKERLRQLYTACLHHTFVRADGTRVPKFVNLDMEEYRDLHLTKELFQEVLQEPAFHSLSAGIVLQAYLPDSYELQQQLTQWALARVAKGGAPIKIRIVKGANLAMEQVEASLRGWPQAPYRQKMEVDANYKRMVEYACDARHTKAVHTGVASHNLFDIAYAMLLRAENRVEAAVSFEMLEGMAEPLRNVVQQLTGSILLYCPVAKQEDFQSAVAYLIRRLDENTGPENFLRHAFGLMPQTPAWDQQQAQFEAAFAQREEVSAEPRRSQNRLLPPALRGFQDAFENEPDTDFSLPQNRLWAQNIMVQFQNQTFAPIPLVIDGQEIHQEVPQGAGTDPSCPQHTAYTYSLATWSQVDRALQTAKIKEKVWGQVSTKERNQMLTAVANNLRLHRGELCGVMMRDGGKTFLEADPEVSEAIDFADYYRTNPEELFAQKDLQFKPKGTVLVAPPWNFPISIPAGGILAALATGNCVIFKPAPETVLCGWLLANLFWEAGVPKDVLQFINCVDDPVGSQLVADPRVSALILTGATSTARLFKRLNAKVDLYAETGGKNAMIITALSDRDLAIKDLVQSAFGHAGQKCSATSLAILEAEVYDDPWFQRQLQDAVRSLKVGSVWDPATKVNPLIRPPGKELLRGLTTLEPGEHWLVQPQCDANNPNLWSPGVKWGVQPGGFTHQTELFGPVLGVMRAENLAHAIELANGTPYGLTTGLHSLDSREQALWKKHIVAGNCYINRTTTGAIVQRQPFGGCKASSFGTGAKAGGPNYLVQLLHVVQKSLPAVDESAHELLKQFAPAATVLPEDEHSLWRASLQSYAYFGSQFHHDTDPAQIVGQDNLFGYRPFQDVVYRIQLQDSLLDMLRIFAAAYAAACPLQVSYNPADVHGFLEEEWLQQLGSFRIVQETEQQFCNRVRTQGFSRIRLASPAKEALYQAASHSASTLITAPVLANGRIELLYYVREVSFSIDYHRYGNLGVRENEQRSAVL